ncbi:MAG: hypothetical protein U7M05_01470 [Candidatus Igneacidithiobacillus chanchocoensis]
MAEQNAHPLISSEEIAVVHNGIIENYQNLRQRLQALGYAFSSETDTEVIARSLRYSGRPSGVFQARVRRCISSTGKGCSTFRRWAMSSSFRACSTSPMQTIFLPQRSRRSKKAFCSAMTRCCATLPMGRSRSSRS